MGSIFEKWTISSVSKRNKKRSDANELPTEIVKNQKTADEKLEEKESSPEERGNFLDKDKYKDRPEVHKLIETLEKILPVHKITKEEAIRELRKLSVLELSELHYIITGRNSFCPESKGIITSISSIVGERIGFEATDAEKKVTEIAEGVYADSLEKKKEFYSGFFERAGLDIREEYFAKKRKENMDHCKNLSDDEINDGIFAFVKKALPSFEEKDISRSDRFNWKDSKRDDKFRCLYRYLNYKFSEIRKNEDLFATAEFSEMKKNVMNQDLHEAFRGHGLLNFSRLPLGFDKIEGAVSHNYAIEERPLAGSINTYFNWGRDSWENQEDYYENSTRIGQPVEELTQKLAGIFAGEEKVLNMGGGQRNFGFEKSINIDLSRNVKNFNRDLIRGDVSNLPFKENYFDGAFAIELVFYVDFPKTSQEIYRALKPGKKFIIGHQGVAGFSDLTTGFWIKGIDIIEYNDYYLPFVQLRSAEDANELMKKTLEEAGFINIEIQTDLKNQEVKDQPYYLVIAEKPE
ncbi:MAG: methyltransferase domain-containing protein [Candidatus Moraniibacteriota bacterium]